jgi:putative membrane protein
LQYKSTIIKPETVYITTVTELFSKKMGILELKIRQSTGGEKRNKNQQ